ncbi:hybrid sensor histidine kinase/response regulator [Catenovulum sediminis]|uniref:hybrid sensor histidine kinase/response regulator n=1 Tax=Catenovulum sediminis TaxID=1740262 RepID=UPI00117C1F92|nr:hybrid sensor histidine kinase/response regulator [Catenovulum sediminis]
MKAMDNNRIKGSLARSTLLQMTLRVAPIVFIMSIMSYWHIVSTLEEQTVDKLAKYIAERGEKENEIFQLAKQNHLIFKNQFIQSYQTADKQKLVKNFDYFYFQPGDGTTRSKSEFFNGIELASGLPVDSFNSFIPRAEHPVSDDLKARLVVAFRLLTRYGPSWNHLAANTYITTPEGAMIGYWQGVHWSAAAPADLDIRNEEWVYVATEQNNPSRKPIWTGLYHDPTADEWMVTLKTPVMDYNGQTLLDVGHDILLNDLFNSVFNDKLEGAYNFIIRKDQRLIAHPNHVDGLLKQKGVLSVAQTQDRALLNQTQLILDWAEQDTARYTVLLDKMTDSFIAVAKMPATEWLFVTVFPKSLLSDSAFYAARFILVLGLGSLIFELWALFLVLRSKVIRPVNSFIDASAGMAQGARFVDQGRNPLPVHRTDEIGQLANTFTAMANTIFEAHEGLEQKVEQRTEQLRIASQEAQSANLAKSEFLAKMSHEIRTPMNAVIGLSQLALKSNLTVEQRDFLTKINSSANVLLGIINDVLDYSKVEAGKLNIEKVQFNLEKIIERSVNICAIKAHSKGIELILDLKPSVPKFIESDPLRLQQVLVNLISNAIKFTETGHVNVLVDAKRHEKGFYQLDFAVIDTGVGMDDAQLSKLFKSFSQADESVTRKYGGTGLGLAISKELVGLMGGDISVKSKKGQGSTFRFSIECAGNNNNQTIKDVTINGRPLRVLIVDDNSISRTVLKDLFVLYKASIVEAVNGIQAIDAVQAAQNSGQQFDLIVMDWRMPEMNGIEASQIIKTEMGKDTLPAILMISSYDKDDAKKQAAENQVQLDAFLEKPVSQSGLFDALIQCLPVDVSRSEHDVTELPVETTIDLSEANILLVEDNKLNRQVAIGFLKETGVQIDIAENGIQAIDKVLHNNYDLVLMDIQMPDMDGLTATREIRSILGADVLPIIAMTAHAMVGDAEKSLNAGMNAHIIKPIDPNELYSMLHRWIDKSKVKRKNKVETRASEFEELLALPMLDISEAIAKMQGRENLYLSLIETFYQDNLTVADAMLQLSNQHALDKLHIKAHSLKSNAAYIGANELARFAHKLEVAIENKDPYEELVDVVVHKLKALLLALKPFIERFGEQEVEPGEFDQQTVDGLLQQLAGYLSQSDAKAEDLVPELKQLRHHIKAVDIVDQLITCIDEIEYEEALEILQANPDAFLLCSHD